MGKRTFVLIAFGAILLFIVVYWSVVSSSYRELGRRENADGTQTVVVGKPRVFGLLGIEIIYHIEDDKGAVLRHFGVRDQCSSWQEARRKHSESNMQEVWKQES